MVLQLYQPEICFDGADNDLDGKIDLQDEECGMTFMQKNNQIPFQDRQRGQIPFDPLLQEEQTGQLLQGPIEPGQRQGQIQPGQIQPGQGRPGQGP